MSDTLKARLPRGFVDRPSADLAATHRMLEAIRKTYELYGFEGLETPFVEYTEALGKFLPDQDRPNEGVFSFQDDDEQWLSLRYDLTAPLARHVAERLDQQSLTLPYRSYRAGWVFRNEKPGPGRFRQFMQFDADTVGSSSPAADAEMCMMMADTLEAVGIPRGQYVVKVNNRKILDGVMEAADLGGDENVARRLTVLRAIDKFDRLGFEGVRELLQGGRTDSSGDRTQGAGLPTAHAERVLSAIDALVELVGVDSPDRDTLRQSISNSLRELNNLSAQSNNDIMWATSESLPQNLGKYVSDESVIKVTSYLRNRYYENNPELEAAAKKSAEGPNVIAWGEETFISDAMTLSAWKRSIGGSTRGQEGIAEVEQLLDLVRSAGYGPGRIAPDPSVVRGLEYYTGLVFEAELTFPVVNDEGQTVRFGSVAGGGRYDGLVGRFRAEPVPATGFSIGVSRLLAALQHVKSPIVAADKSSGPAVVLVMDRDRIADYQAMVAKLRRAGIPAELYLGSAGMKAQMKYADRRCAPCVIIQGSQEKADEKVQIKDLFEGARAAADAASSNAAEYKAARLAQVSVPEADLVDEVRKIVASRRG